MTIQTRAAWIAAMDAVINDNSSGDISPADVRGSLDNLAASIIFPEDMAGYLWGATLSNNAGDATNDIDVAAGKVVLTDGSTGFRLVAVSALTKRLDAAWAVGTNQGGLSTGSIANTTYHMYIIQRTDFAAVDMMFDVSATAPTLPANYTFYRRIGSVIRASAALLPFVQHGDHFELKSHVLDVDVSNLGTTATLYALTVPDGINVEAEFNYQAYKTAANVSINVYSPNRTDETAAGTSARAINPYNESTISSQGGGRTRVMTNTAKQIKAVADAASCLLKIGTIGWWDTRGRLA